MNEIITEFTNVLLKGDKVQSAQIVEKYISNFFLIEKLIVESLEKIGELWENGEISLAQVYISGIICEELMGKWIKDTQVKNKIDLNLAIVVLEDYHTLGKKIVQSILQSAGYVLKDYGMGKSVDEVVDLVIKDNIEILLISTLMLPSALKVNYLKRKLQEKGKKTKIIVGGAPFRIDKTLWKDVEADAHATHAFQIFEILKKMVKNDERNDI
ncbi:Methanogenic corrinoid protein MtbC1 [Marinitoga hydrogenitolerans DSM 16785]|uniref:Methanogenic corrinoid protein MtbC1 n=1 Tax=Marinitoga hydrogenitolerans (strain DSM 16785 / JCM 12826 / AT1271) TaxID=1122195 RepID=A0A1M4YA75_MARH1|nr:cobalamin-dependent protein [Marinitoga hydrogenitolerans]SHF02600.1 Methanogenic corrinoid protein MtbC1 [Marinitoga hydrogenitolerans DSM 16785]